MSVDAGVFDVPATYECPECNCISERAGYCDACRDRFRAENELRRARKRRERIATAALQGFAAHGWVDPDVMARRAVEAADSLIAALDRD